MRSGARGVVLQAPGLEVGKALMVPCVGWHADAKSSAPACRPPMSERVRVRVRVVVWLRVLVRVRVELRVVIASGSRLD